MWWPATGGYYVEAIGSCLFHNVSFLSYFLTFTPSMNGFAELPAIRWHPPMQNPGYATADNFALPVLSALSFHLLGTSHKKMSMGQVFQVDIDACVSVGESDI